MIDVNISKKRRLAVTVAVLALFLLCAAAFSWGIAQMSYAQSGPSAPEFIGSDAAVAYALADAGCSQDEAALVSCEIDYDDGVARHYEVDLVVGTTSHQYEIDLYTGAILKHERVIQPSDAPSSQPVYIGGDAAADIALAHAGVTSSDVYSMRSHIDSEDSRTVYDVEFSAAASDGGSAEFDYEIDAVTGEILSYERELQPAASPTPVPSLPPVESVPQSQSAAPSQAPSPSSSPTLVYIGEEAAKSAAYAHAGCQAGEVSSVICKLDYEDGHPHCYEVEFICGDYEYEYDIDLYTGAVLKHEREHCGGSHHGNSHHAGAVPGMIGWHD